MTIYALKEKGRIVYVGATSNPKRRRYQWGIKKNHLKRAFNPSSFCPLRQACPESALRIEAQIIRALKRRGQCELNTQEGLHLRKIECVETGRIFHSIAEAAQWSGYSPVTVAKHLRDHDFFIMFTQTGRYGFRLRYLGDPIHPLPEYDWILPWRAEYEI